MDRLSWKKTRTGLTARVWGGFYYDLILSLDDSKWSVFTPAGQSDQRFNNKTVAVRHANELYCQQKKGGQLSIFKHLNPCL